MGWIYAPLRHLRDLPLVIKLAGTTIGALMLLIAAQDLRVVAQDVQAQQTVGGIRSALNRAAQLTETATTLLHGVAAGPDQKPKTAERGAGKPRDSDQRGQTRRHL